MHSMRFFSALAAATLAVAICATAGTHEAAGVQAGAVTTSPYKSVGHSHQANQYYASVWGVEQLRLQRTASGALIRFSYRVVDADKAKAVHEKKAEPHLLGLRSHAMLSVPSLENVGQLRQTEAITAGKDYWILFSNKGDLVKVGDRVDVIIGDFYANSLTVE